MRDTLRAFRLERYDRGGVVGAVEGFCEKQDVNDRQSRIRKYLEHGEGLTCLEMKGLSNTSWEDPLRVWSVGFEAGGARETGGRGCDEATDLDMDM